MGIKWELLSSNLSLPFKYVLKRENIGNTGISYHLNLNGE